MSDGNGERLQKRFAGRTIGVATLHGKDRVIGPALIRMLPIADCLPIVGVVTDRFGAFSGEAARVQDPLETCKAKAKHGVEVSGLDLVIASEGSFFPYPPAPFVPCDEEILVLYDARDDSFFVHRHVSLQTVFGGENCTTWGQARSFAERMKFPDHGLLVRAKEKWSAGDAMLKGIADEGELRDFAASLFDAHGSCWVETDMRAMMNPTRMAVIAETAQRFAQELAMICPTCGACWFRITQAIHGLQCELCGWPTQSTRSYLRTCRICANTSTTLRPDGKTAEEPQHCGNCNP